MQNIKKTLKKVICPECKGNKTAAYFEDNENYSGFSWKPCGLCGGEGMVLKIKTVEFKHLEYAN